MVVNMVLARALSAKNISNIRKYLSTYQQSRVLQKWQDEAEHWKSQPTICHTANNSMAEVSIELCKAMLFNVSTQGFEQNKEKLSIALCALSSST